jgi:predicted nucleotidyltransferase
VTFNLEDYIQSTGIECKSLLKARQVSEKLKSELTSIVHEKRLYDLETAMVFYGSLARGEVVDGSDLDWTLLIDGQAKVSHKEVSDSIQDAIKLLKLKEPSKNGFFGDLTYSHDLAHYIGGEDDTNQIISKRMLYLLESGTVPVSNGAVIHSRIIYAIIENYISLDSTFKSPEGTYARVPRLY